MLFELVQDRTSPCLADAEGLCDGRRNQRRIGNRCEGHKEDAVREALDELTSDLQSQPRLAAAARAGQREKAGASELTANSGGLVCPADEACALHRQVVQDICVAD